ncbi:phage tail tape measure protein [Streptomyces microflavus]
MARPITITLLGDLDDLSRSLNEGTRDVTRFADQVEDALRQATEEAERLGDEVAGGADDAGSSLGGLAEKFGGLAGAAGIAVGAGLFAGIKEAMDRESGNDLLAAQLGANPSEAKRLGEAAGGIYSSGWGESVADANTALKALWQQGLVPAGATAAEMTKIGKSAMDVANVLGEEVGPTANAVGTMMKNGLAKNADEAMDVLVAGTQRGANKAEDLLDTFNEYSVQFKKVGLDGKTSMGLIQQGLQGGARDADTVADAIKEFSIRAIDGSATTVDGFKSIGLNADDMRDKIAAGGPAAQQALGLTLNKLRAIKDPAERSAAAVNLFGTKAEDMGESLYSLNVDTAVDALGKVDGAAKRAGDTMHDNASQKITAFWRGLQTLGVDVIGGTVLPVLDDLIGTAQAVGKFIGDNRVPITAVAGVITVLLLPALVAWGVTATTSAIANGVAWTTSTATASASAATQVLAHWSVVGGWLKAGGQALISGALIAGQWIAGAAAAVLNGGIMVAQWVLMGTQSMIQAARMAAAWLLAMGPIPLIIAAVVALALLIWQNWDDIKRYTGAAFDWVWGKVKAVFGFLKDLFLNFTGPGLLIKHWDTIKAKTAAAFTFVKDKAKAGLDGVVGFFRDLPGRILGHVGKVGAAAANVGRAIIDRLGQGLSKLSSFGQNIGNAVARGLKSSINSLIDLLNWAIPDRIGIGPVGVNLPKNPIPKIRAMGGPASGLTRVGERGPEEVYLPKGSHVIPNHAGSASSGVTVNVATNADPWAIGREVAWALRVAPR